MKKRKVTRKEEIALVSQLEKLGGSTAEELPEDYRSRKVFLRRIDSAAGVLQQLRAAVARKDKDEAILHAIILHEQVGPFKEWAYEVKVK
jgi:hypothetical protein